jgi:GT2 family glycosyltransferase
MSRISIITPVFDPPLWALEKCVDSVLNQTCEDWEFIVVDDASTNRDVSTYIKALESLDSRIRVVHQESNSGIAAASQVALDTANSEFIALLDHDDELHPEALEYVLMAIQENQDCDYLYTDEDKIDQQGNHFDLFLKPDWSPERLRGQNYCCHLSVFRTDVVRNVGGFRPGFDGSQDYDLILRVTEVARTIVHIPEVLYHWRAIPGSTASSTSEKPQAYVAAHRALQDHLDRLGIDGRVEDAGFGYHKIVRLIKSEPSVSIVIPTCGSEKVIFGNRTVLVENVLESVRSKTNYSKLEVVVVADTHTAPHVMETLQEMTGPNFKLIEYSKPFNFSDKCNVGFAHSVGEVVLLLNDDVEVIDSDWLSTLVPLALESDVGLVGPMLLLEDGRIQSASHSNTPSPHNFRNGYLAQSAGEFGILAIARECSGVTGAAALLRRDVYEEVGGLSVQFPNCFNDVDLAFKLLEAGYRIIWTPHARLYHFESVSRDSTVDKKELDLLMDRWGRYFDNDRFNRLN